MVWTGPKYVTAESCTLPANIVSLLGHSRAKGALEVLGSIYTLEDILAFLYCFNHFLPTDSILEF
jgi:hypothetical protein